MPELPDVEIFERYLDRTALHRRVEDAEVDRARLHPRTAVALPGRFTSAASSGADRRLW